MYVLIMSEAEAVLELFESQFSYTIDSVSPISVGSNFISHRVTCTDNTTVFVKGTVDGDDVSLNRLYREVLMLTELENQFVSFVPELDDSWIGEGGGVVVLSLVSGDEWNETVLQSGEEMAQSVGERLQSIHSLLVTEEMPVSEYGVDGSGLATETAGAIQGTSFEKYMNTVTECERILSETKSNTGVIHGDFHPPNVLFDVDGQISNVIDWEYAGVGDTTIDIAKAEVRFFELYAHLYEEIGIDVSSLRERFRESYGFDAVSSERLDALKLLYVLREGGLVEKYGSLEIWDELSDVSAVTVCDRWLEDNV